MPVRSTFLKFGGTLVLAVVSLCFSLLALLLQPQPSRGQSCAVPGGYASLAAAVTDPTCSNIILAAATFTETVVISRNLHIQGAGLTGTIINGNGLGPIIAISSTAVVTLSDMQIRDGLIPSDQSIGGAGIRNDGTLLMQRVVLTGHSAPLGAGLHNRGIATVQDSDINNNTSARDFGPGVGSGIYNEGTLQISDSRFEDNYASGYSFGSGGFGAGIANYGMLTVTRTLFENNSSGGGETPGGNGPAIYNADGRMTVLSSTFRANNAFGGQTSNANARGGAIYNSGTSTFAFIRGSHFENNRANDGGAIYVFDGSLQLQQTEILSHTAYGFNDDGGALYISSAGRVIVQAGTFEGNSRDLNGKGGAVYNEGIFSATALTLRNNQATEGGAIVNENGQFILISSRVISNQAADWGGGIYNFGGNTDIFESTFSDNRVTAETGEGGGLYLEGGSVIVDKSSFYRNLASQGGGIRNSGGILTMSHSTVSGNYASIGGGVNAGNSTRSTLNFSTIVSNTAFVEAANLSTSPQVTVSNSILGYPLSSTNCAGQPANSGGHNLDSDGSCLLQATGDLSNTDPLLLPLAQNGGPLPSLPFVDDRRSPLSHLPQPGSPAIDAASTAGCVGSSDQNFRERPEGITDLAIQLGAAGCDIGAVEVTRGQLYNDLNTWTRYFNTINQLVAIGHNFRTQELTLPGERVTTIDDVSLNFATFTEGRLFYRYCARYETIDPGVACEPYAYSPGGPEGQAIPALDQAVGSGEPVSIDIHNTLALAQTAYDEVYLGPSGGIISATIDGVALSTTLQTAAISGTLAALREQVAIPVVFGNEFLVDALRFSFGRPDQSGAEIISEEIAQLEQARQQFDLATEIFLQGSRRPMGGSGDVYLSQFFTADDLETFGLTAERQTSAVLEIAQRQQRLVANEAELESIIDTLNEAYLHQYMQGLAFYSAVSETPNADDTFINNGGSEIVRNLARITALVESIRAGNNPLGYEENYVPRASFESLRAEMGESGTCDPETGQVSGSNNGHLGDMLEAECTAAAAERNFDQNAQEMEDELVALNEAFAADLRDLCGAGAESNNFLICNGGDMVRNYQDIQTANRAVALAWQRAENIPQLIAIEQERAADVINITLSTGRAILADQLAIAKLEGYQEITTVAQTQELFTPGSTNDYSSGAYWLDFAEDATSCLLAGATLGALGDGCQGNLSNGFDAIGELLGVEETPVKVETVEAVWNPQAEQIAEIQGMQMMREFEAEAQIEGANSAAEIKRLLLQQSDLLIEYEIAVSELNRVLVERNLLIERHRDLLNRRARAQVALLDDYLNKPAYRIIRDNRAAQAASQFETTVNLVYLNIKALEYNLLDEPQGVIQSGPLFGQNLYTALYQARNTSHLDAIIAELDATQRALSGAETYLRRISVAQDILGYTNENLQPLLPYTPPADAPNWPTSAECAGPITTADTLRTCFFRQYALSRVITDTELTNNQPSLLFAFGTAIEQINPDLFLWNSRIAPEGVPGDEPACNASDPCQGVTVNLLTGQSFGSGNPLVQLTHDGQATYRRQFGPGQFDTEIVTYNPGPTALVGQPIPAGFPQGNRVTGVIETQVNGSGGSVVGSFRNLSSAVTAWEFNLNLNTSGVDLAQLSDIEIVIDTIAYPIQSNRIAAELAQLQAERLDAQEAGRTVPATTEATFRQLLRQFEIARQGERAGRRAPALAARPQIDRNDQYNGNLSIAGPVNMGMVDIGLTLSRNGSQLSGHLCSDCTPLYTLAAGLSGVFSATGTLTDGFQANTTAFTQSIGGRVVTRTLTFAGDVLRNGKIISGTYRESIAGFTAATFEVTGNIIAARSDQIGSGARLQLSAATTELRVGQQTPITLTLSGVPLTQTTTITFSTNLGSVNPSVTSTDANGQAVTIFAAGNTPGRATIEATNGAQITRLDITVLAANEPPNTPGHPSPANNSTDIPTNVTLNWQGNDPNGNDLTYTVAFGSSSPPPVLLTTTNTSLRPTAILGNPLLTTTTYYWQITASDGLSQTTGPIWSFTTAATINRDNKLYLPLILR